MIRWSGDLQASQALKANGHPARFATIWLGPWSRVENGRLPDLAAFMAACKAEGFQPHVQLFGAGDQNTEAFWEGGVTTTRGMDLGRWWALVKAIGATFGTTPGIVTLEPEWAKKTIIDGAPKFDEAWANAAYTIRGQAPHVEVVNCPGEWATGATVKALFPKMVAATKVWGIQNLRGLTRDSATKYASGPNDLVARAADYKATFGKPIIVTDLCYSTYGGQFNSAHPFLGGDPRAADGLQAKAFERLASISPALEGHGVTDVIIRSLRDVDMDEWGNHYGLAEDSWGLQRQDGTVKPAYPALMLLAGPGAPVAPTRAEYDAVVAERDAAVIGRDAALARLAAIHELSKP